MCVDLEQDITAGRFRRDLFYRLSVFSVATPPLRERKADIVLLAQHFLERLAQRTGRKVLGFTPEALALLSTYDYPGNVRELENEIERAFALADSDTYITADLLSAKFTGLKPEQPAEGGTIRAAVERFEAQLIREALQRNGGNQTKTAVELGLSRRGLIDKLQKYALR